MLPYFPDCIVQHAILLVLEDIWDKRFLYQSYSCRKGKGQHRASALCMQYVRRYKYVLKCDISKFFYSIPHTRLKSVIRRKIKCKGSMINVVEIQNVSSQHLFFCMKRGEIVMMKPTEFVQYVDTLPDDCIENRTDKEIRFHLPRGDNVCCPECGSVRTYVQQYRPQNLHGIPNADKQYVYNRRRYRCQNCGKTFVERSPFLAGFQRRIGNRLRQIRAQKKITQRQVINALNIPYHAYKSYEDDTAPVVPPTLVAMQIANYLGTDVLEIWGDQLGGGTA